MSKREPSVLLQPHLFHYYSVGIARWEEAGEKDDDLYVRVSGHADDAHEGTEIDGKPRLTVSIEVSDQPDPEEAMMGFYLSGRDQVAALHAHLGMLLQLFLDAV